MNEKQVAEIRTYKIYKHELPNGKVYIGATSAEKLYERFKYGSGYASQPFGAAVAEYGWSQVSTVVLEEITGTFAQATIVETYWIQKHMAEGYEVCNKIHAAPPKEYKYNCGGCTILETNTYYESFAAAARFIGVTKQAIRLALQENRPCKGWHLVYGDKTEVNE